MKQIVPIPTPTDCKKPIDQDNCSTLTPFSAIHQFDDGLKPDKHNVCEFSVYTVIMPMSDDASLSMYGLYVTPAAPGCREA